MAPSNRVRKDSSVQAPNERLRAFIAAGSTTVSALGFCCLRTGYLRVKNGRLAD